MGKKKWIFVIFLAAMLAGGCSSREQFVSVETVRDEIPPETRHVEEKGSMVETETETVMVENGLIYDIEDTAPEGTRPVPEENETDYAFIEMDSIVQNPELPTGCESVALTIVLDYLGFELEKTTIADEYLVFAEDNFAKGYVGDPHTRDGAGVFPPGLVDTADNFFVANGSAKRAFDISDTGFERLYDYVAEEIPVIVWNTMYMEEPAETDTVCEYKDKVYRWFCNEHCVVFCGFNRENGTVYIQDPLEGLVERDADTFAEYYDMIGQYAMIIH